MTNPFSCVILCPSNGGTNESESLRTKKSGRKPDFGHAPPSAGDQAHTAALSDGKQESASPCLPFPGREAPCNPIVNRSAREVENLWKVSAANDDFSFIVN